MTSALVSTEWLAAHLSAPDVKVVDASWHMPASGRNGRAEFEASHIPGAVFFDIDTIADITSPMPHTVPQPERFSSMVRKLGLGDGHRIVCYDSGNGLGAARAWWMFRLFGHRDVTVLDGGFAKWVAEGRAVSDEPPLDRERHFTARVQGLLLKDIDQMRANLTSGRAQVLDARSRGRFEGTEAEPRAGVRSGHIPGSRNLPFSELYNEDRTLKAGAALADAVAAAGIDPKRPVITTCGSGVTACVLALALHELGAPDVAVYDGSWTEWGSSDAPLATGPAA